MAVNPATMGLGLGLTGLSTLGGFMASNKREDAFNRAIGQRERESSGINQQRTDLRNNFTRGLQPIAEQGQGMQLDALRSLLQLGQQGNQAGMDQIQGARQELAGMAPTSQAFGTGVGPGQQTLQRFQSQQQPMMDAQAQLAAQGLSGFGRQRGDILRQQQLGLTENQAGLQRLQANNAIGSANIGLDDLLSQLRFNAASNKAKSKGQGLDAFSQLAGTAGGIALGASFGG